MECLNCNWKGRENEPLRATLGPLFKLYLICPRCKYPLITKNQSVKFKPHIPSFAETKEFNTEYNNYWNMIESQYHAGVNSVWEGLFGETYDDYKR